MPTLPAKFVVANFVARSTEDSYENGEIPNGSGSCWTDRDISVPGYFDTIAEALEAVCKANYFTFHPEWWDFDEYNEDFYTDILVDVNNYEATESQIERWRKGEERLWNCRIHATIMKQAEPTPVDEEEAKNWMKSIDISKA